MNIWTPVIAVLSALVGVLNALLPDWEPVELDGAFDAIAPHVAKFFAFVNWSDHYVPTKQAITAIGLMLTLYVARAIFGAAVKILTWMHVLGGDGAV